MMADNLLYYGDNLEVLRLHVKEETVDLVYLDPPFNSNATYNVLFAEKNGSESAAQIKAFEDTWHWDQAAAEAFQRTLQMGGQVARAMTGLEILLGTNDMLAYLTMMAPRLVELRRVLKPTGSVYLHCDPTASHYIKLLMDAVFGANNFRNEIIWRRTGSNSALKRFGPLHQTILYYTNSDGAPFYPVAGPYTKQYIQKFFKDEDARGRYQSVALTGPGTRKGDSGKPWKEYDPGSVGRHWQPSSYVYDKYQERTGEDLAKYPLLERLDKLDEIGMIHWGKKAGGVPRYKYYLADAPGVYLQDIWAFQPGTDGCVYGRPDEGIDQDVKWLSQEKERLGYPTQKPEGVLERIVRSSSKEGDIILDPFCGCGTTIAVAQQLKRRWIGIDITHLAINLIKHRLLNTFGDEVSYEVIGEPEDISGAEQLAQDPFQFQSWALGLVKARPVQVKKGADQGIDGRLPFQDEVEAGRAKYKQVILSVKSGKAGVTHVRDLLWVVEREKAAIGVLITLQEPTQPMRAEAAGAGLYESALLGQSYPRMQILTIAELLAGKRIEMPPIGLSVTFKRASRVKRKPSHEQLALSDKGA